MISKDGSCIATTSCILQEFGFSETDTINIRVIGFPLFYTITFLEFPYK
jgi:hypothetical protein